MAQLAVSANNVTSLLGICVKPLRNTFGALDNAEVSVVVVVVFGYGAIYKKVPFFTDFCVLKQKKSIGLVYPQF